MSQRHCRHSPSHSLSLQALHTLPPVLNAVVGHKPTKALCCPCQEWLFPLGARVEPSSSNWFVLGFIQLILSLQLCHATCRRGGGRQDPTFSTQGLSGVVLHPRQPGCALAVVQHPSSQIHVVAQCGFSPVNQETNDDTPAAEEDLLLPPGWFNPPLLLLEASRN